MSYIMPKKLSSEFQSHSIKIKNFKINPINPFNPNKTKGGEGVNILNVILGMSYNLPKALTSEYQSPSIKIDDFKINPFNPFNPISTKGGSQNVKLITRNVFEYAQYIKFQILEP